MAGPREELRRALHDLYARIPLGMRLGLEPMRAACGTLGHPERGFAAVHVAGTNGKGSVCAMVERVLRAAGKRTGLYTSPHLHRFAERIRIDGEPLDDAALAPLLEGVLRRAPDLSFFEAATAAAFVAFREARVDVAVLEVGIGGRLDATNVIPAPVAAAVTRIALDHTDRLGPTLADIAREKAGIAKEGSPLVLGPIDGETLAVIEAVAKAAGAPLMFAEGDEGAGRALERVQVGLAGAHQRENARVAYVLARCAGADETAQSAGLAAVRWPARLESVETPSGEVLLDAAHNPDGMASLAHHLALRGAAPGSTALVFGSLADKAWAEMLDLVAPSAHHRVYVRPTIALPAGRGASDPAIFAARHEGRLAAGVREALDLARAAVGPAGLVVVAGSIFLAAEARAHLLGLEGDPPVAL